MIQLFFQKPSRRLLNRLGVITLLLGGILLPASGRGDDLTDCMTGMMQQADDEMTIGDLRRLCREKLHQETLDEEDTPPAALSQRLERTGRMSFSRLP
jgi:hypothetical protein